MDEMSKAWHQSDMDEKVDEMREKVGDMMPWDDDEDEEHYDGDEYEDHDDDEYVG